MGKSSVFAVRFAEEAISPNTRDGGREGEGERGNVLASKKAKC